MFKASMATAPAISATARAQPLLVRRAAVLGAGTMGSRIAAHLANAGIPALLLDLSRRRRRSAATAWPKRRLLALAKAKPAAFYEPSLAALITPGNFDDDLPKLAQCDWVIEAVAENLEIKTALLARVAAASCAAGGADDEYIRAAGGARSPRRSQSHRERFFGTHFFNPPRYMRLLEVIPTPRPIRRWWLRLPRLPTACWASRWCLPTTRRTSSPTASASR